MGKGHGTILTLNSALWVMLIAVVLVLARPAASLIEGRMDRRVDRRIELYERDYKRAMDSLMRRVDSLESILNRTTPGKYSAVMTIDRVSMYNPVRSQTDATPTTTASGRKIKTTTATEHRWIAVSQEMLAWNGGPLSFGDLVYLSGVGPKTGYYTVADAMPSKWLRTVDILETVGAPLYLYKNAKLFKI